MNEDKKRLFLEEKDKILEFNLIDSSLLTINAPYDRAGMKDATYEFNIKVTSFSDLLATDSESASITIKATPEEIILSTQKIKISNVLNGMQFLRNPI